MIPQGHSLPSRCFPMYMLPYNDRRSIQLLCTCSDLSYIEQKNVSMRRYSSKIKLSAFYRNFLTSIFEGPLGTGIVKHACSLSDEVSEE